MNGVAALSLALFHFHKGSLLNSSFTQDAWILVDYFFVLSGLVMTLNYENRLKNWSQFLAFQLIRFWRIYPLHFANLSVLVLFEVLRLGIVEIHNYQAMMTPFTEKKIFTPNDSGEAIYGFQNPWVADVTVAISLLLLLVTSDCSYHWIEEKFQIKPEYHIGSG